jgi:dienelactone hydrolase
MSTCLRAAAIVAVAAFLTTASITEAQQEFPPPQGKGRVVVLASGMSGPDHYKEVAAAIASLGYDVVLFDGNSEENTHGQGVKRDILAAQTMPHALPGKVALVGFSLGGGEMLYWGTQSSDQVAGAVVWYPANAFIRDIPGFANRLAVPVVVFAGGKDRFRNGCCTADKDSALEQASKSTGKSFDLTVYPDADHDFVKGGNHYNAQAYDDAMQRTAAALKLYLAN